MRSIYIYSIFIGSFSFKLYANQYNGYMKYRYKICKKWMFNTERDMFQPKIIMGFQIEGKDNSKKKKE